MADANEVVAFTSMAEGTREDYELLERLEAKFAAGTADRVLELLRGLAGSLAGYQVDRLEHSLQCATRALCPKWLCCEPSTSDNGTFGNVPLGRLTQFQVTLASATRRSFIICSVACNSCIRPMRIPF